MTQSDSNPRLPELGPDYCSQRLDTLLSTYKLFVYVAGSYLCVSTSGADTAEPFVEPLNHSVLFLKGTDIILSSDAWQVALNWNISTYKDVLSSIKSDLGIILEHQEEFTPLSELRQVVTLVDNLESSLGQYKQMFPKKELKRSLLDLDGTVLRALFGTATMTDLHRPHEALGELQDKNSEVAHPLSKQVMFIRDLNTVASLNTKALVNLSSIVKDNVVKSHSKFQESSRNIAWLNDTLLHQSEMYIHVRQLEYSLMLASQQVCELFTSVQYALLGKLPVSLVTPTTLYRILTDILWIFPRIMN